MCEQSSYKVFSFFILVRPYWLFHWPSPLHIFSLFERKVLGNFSKWVFFPTGCKSLVRLIRLRINSYFVILIHFLLFEYFIAAYICNVIFCMNCTVFRRLPWWISKFVLSGRRIGLIELYLMLFCSILSAVRDAWYILCDTFIKMPNIFSKTKIRGR